MIGGLQTLIFLVLALALFGVEVWALVDAARRPASAFVTAGKRTKTFWLILTGVAAVIGFLTLPPPVGVAQIGGFFMFIAVVPAGIYLADVRPAVAPYSRRRPPSSPGNGW
ncbi:DUF2516 family protein [Bogoriella caseilytica]|uniref:Uncharacterized protein DUF2516 n=1 Tax=Bogoriella caseilytica TaxID=56055 RepID=A0A3N2BB59_9MICO|nr:DUF2516 family protein [Bogoriella caseilytica]ROR72487.1 uncharacterized protein DUF2516 [Bogoriella caseilytica]